MANPKPKQKKKSIWSQAWPYTIGALSASVISNLTKTSKKIADSTVDATKDRARESSGSSRQGLYAAAGVLGLGVGYAAYRSYKGKSLAPTQRPKWATKRRQM